MAPTQASLRRRPFLRCPLCGTPVLVCVAQSHLGGARCLLDMQSKQGGTPFDRERGPELLVLARKVTALLAEVPRATG